jgi:ankyrin repeat protein
MSPPDLRLITAVELGRSDVVKELLDSEDDIIHVCDTENKNALFYAFKTGHVEIARTLISHGAANLKTIQLVDQYIWENIDKVTGFAQCHIISLIYSNVAYLNQILC